MANDINIEERKIILSSLSNFFFVYSVLKIYTTFKDYKFMYLKNLLKNVTFYNVGEKISVMNKICN